MKRIVVTSLYAGFMSFASAQQVATIGKPLPAWQEGYLDLHHINTGRGSCAYYIFPDGTTMLFDAGEMNPESPRTMSPRNTVIRPDNSKKPYEWIAHYIGQVAPDKKNIRLDYAALSHFHDDHFGSWYRSAPISSSGKYALTGITGVGDRIPISNMLDRGYPAYDIPVSQETYFKKLNIRDTTFGRSLQNYRQFISAQQEKGMKPAQFKAGSRSQIRLLKKPFPDFFVQNVKSNGWIWTGNDSSVFQHFPPLDTANTKTWPDENSLSLVFTINYGPFIYYSGGDCPGNVFYGDAPWRDVETPVARAVGEVDIATLDHHGNRDAINEFLVKTFKPRVWIGQSWSADHPGHEVLIRMTTPHLYEGERDVFATNMLESNRNVIGPLIDRSYKSQQGHIVVRVMPGGKNYYVIILDDSRADMPVKNVFGPYTSKKAKAEKYKLIGHRGGVVDSSYTENSMPALQAAVKRGYYMVEIDVRLTKDSQLIAQHDPTFNRYYHVNRASHQLSWDSVRILKSDRDNSSPLLFEDVLKYCSGKLEIMLDNKITGNDTASFRKIETLMRKYNLLKNALIIGTTETRNYFKSKSKVGYNLSALQKMAQSAGFKPGDYFLFDHGNVLTREAVNWALQEKILIVPSINKFHYTNIHPMQGADRDISQLKNWGVEFYQIDSEFDRWLR